jgi:hypothetical protein
MLESFSEIMTLEESAKYLKIGKYTLYNIYYNKMVGEE